MSGKTPTTPPRFLKLLPSTSVGRLVQRACVILRMSLGNMHTRALQTRDLSYDHYHMCTIHSGIGNKTGDHWFLTLVCYGQRLSWALHVRRLFNQMWILKNSKELLENLNSNSLASVHSIKTYDFSTLYTTIPHSKLKS